MMAGDGINVDREQFHEAVAFSCCCCSGPCHGQTLEEDAEGVQVGRRSLSVSVSGHRVVGDLFGSCGAPDFISDGPMTTTTTTSLWFWEMLDLDKTTSWVWEMLDLDKIDNKLSLESVIGQPVWHVWNCRCWDLTFWSIGGSTTSSWVRLCHLLQFG